MAFTTVTINAEPRRGRKPFEAKQAFALHLALSLLQKCAIMRSVDSAEDHACAMNHCGHFAIRSVRALWLILVDVA